MPPWIEGPKDVLALQVVCIDLICERVQLVGEFGVGSWRAPAVPRAGVVLPCDVAHLRDGHGHGHGGGRGRDADGTAPVLHARLEAQPGRLVLFAPEDAAALRCGQTFMAWLPSISCRAVAEKMKWTRYATSESKVSAGSPNLSRPRRCSCPSSRSSRPCSRKRPGPHRPRPPRACRPRRPCRMTAQASPHEPVDDSHEVPSWKSTDKDRPNQL